MVYYFNSIINCWVIVDLENAYDLFKYEDICLKMIDMDEEDVKIWIAWIDGMSTGFKKDTLRKFQNFNLKNPLTLKRLASGEKFTFSNNRFIFIQEKIDELETDLDYYRELNNPDI